MEILLAIACLVLFVLFISASSRLGTLRAEVEALRADLGAQEDALDSLLDFKANIEMMAGMAPLAEAAVAERAEVATAPPIPAVPPSRPPEHVLAPVHDVLAEAVPGVAVASAVVGLAQQRRRGPSLVQRWMRELRGTEEWEALIGGRLLNRVGAVALILGIAFFFKYAVDQNWISQGVRIGIGLLVGAGLLALAHRAHQRGYTIFGQGLVGVGLAVLYLSVFASFNFYHLVPQPVALAGMLAISGLALIQALYYDSVAVSLLACLGGYATPFLLSGGNPVGTLAYLFLLDAGVLTVAARRRLWAVLSPIALGATYATYFSWYLSSYSSDRLLLAAVGVSLFWALFLAFDLYTLLSTDSTWPQLDHALGAVNGLAYYGALFALVEPHHRSWMTVLSLAIGAIYLGALLLLRRRHEATSAVMARFALSAMILLVVATAVEFRGFTVVVLWSLEALPLVWYGTRSKLWYVWRPALVLYALAVGWLFATPGALSSTAVAHFVPLVNQRALAYLVLAAALAVSTVPISRLHRDRSDAIAVSLHWGWTVLIFVLLTVETTDLFRRFATGSSSQTVAGLDFDRSLTIALLWMAFSLPLVWFGVQKRVLTWVQAGLGGAALAAVLGAVVGVAFEPIQRYTPILNVRVAALLLLAGGLALHLRRLRGEGGSPVWREGVRPALQVGILLLGFDLVSAEVNDYFQHRAGHPLPSMDLGTAFVELAVLASLWMLYALLPAWLGVRKRTMPLIVLGLSMGAAATGAGALGGIVFQPSRQLAVLLGVRPIVLAILVAGLSIQLRWLRQKSALYRWSGGVVIALQAAIILLGFGLISAETRDAFAQRIAGAGAQQAAGLRDLEKLAFSLVWLVYAMVVLAVGIWRRALWMRVAAMALFAFVILKVFIYDLSFLGAVYRPISFVGLGVMLLAVSFLYQRYRRQLFAAA